MSAETDFQALLSGHTPLTDLVGDRIALAAVPGSAELVPAVVFLARHDVQGGIGSGRLADAVTFTVQCWADTALAAAAVADAAEGACDNAPGVNSCHVAAREPVYDEETALDGVVLTVEWWVL